MLFVAVLPLPYGYYQLLRVVVFGCASLLCWKAYVDGGKQLEKVSLTFGAMALLMNPFLPVELPRIAWMGFNVLFGAIFLLNLPRQKSPAEPHDPSA
jgi:hypothetical protein